VGPREIAKTVKRAHRKKDINSASMWNCNTVEARLEGKWVGLVEKQPCLTIANNWLRERQTR